MKVNPSKNEVRFRHSSIVHDLVRDTIREVLKAQRPASRIPTLSTPQPSAGLPFSEFIQRLENMDASALMTLPASSIPGSSMHALPSMPVDSSADPSALPEFTLRRPPSPMPRFEFTEDPSSTKLAVPDTHGPLFPNAALPEPENLDALRDLRPLGQIHDSFIIAAGRDGLWIIDQHVAHERILFEQVLAARSQGRRRDAAAS